VKLLKEIDADIVASNYTWINHTTRLPEKRQEYPFEKIEYNKLYQFEEIVGKTIIDMHATTVKTELFRKANEQIDEHTFYVDVEFIAFPIPYVKTVYFMEDPVYQYRLGLPGQSMSIEKMQKNLKNHLRVLMRLNQYCKKVEKTAPKANLEYIRELTATILTSQMKIYISFPLKNEPICSITLSFVSIRTSSGLPFILRINAYTLSPASSITNTWLLISGFA